MSENRSAEEVKDLQRKLKELKNFIDAIEKLGVGVEDLKGWANAIEIAVNTGADIGLAAQQTSEVLKKYTDDLYAACPKDELEYVCLASIDTKYQARSVRWTLSFDEKNSVVNNSIRNILKRYVPERICSWLDSCK